jgi:hypothetical protein
MKVLKPVQSLKNLPSNIIKMFLGGSIDMGNSKDWQKEIETELKDENVILLNPRRDDWDSSWKQEIENDQFREQVEWELEAQEKSDIILMNFLPTSQAPISLLETGLAAKESKLIVCCPKGYWRKGNIDIVCKKYGIILLESQEDLVKAAKEAVKQYNANRV